MRRAGVGLTETGERVSWSVAEGRRGRRWREAVVGEQGLLHALLLETGPDGRFTHLELATPAGLLTLHPEADGTLHGNVLDVNGLRHVTGLPWEADACVAVVGSPIAQAAIAVMLRHDVLPGASTERLALTVGPDLRPVTGRSRITRLTTEAWQLRDGRPFAADADGLPSLAEGTSWPMEPGEPG